MDADKTEKKQRGKPFAKGQSGNPNGRPGGSRNKVTLAIEELLDGEAEALTRKCIEKALDGDMAALRLCMERICPVRRNRAVTFDLPALDNLGDAVQITGTLLQAVANGDVTPTEAQSVAGVIEAHRKTVEIVQIDERLSQLEERLKR